MIEISKKRLARAKSEKVDIRQLAVAELAAWGWDVFDAMLIVGLLKESDEKTEAARLSFSYAADENFDKLVKKRTTQLRNGSVLDVYQKIHPTPGTPRANAGAKRANPTITTSGKASYFERKLWQGDIEPVADEEILAAMWDTISQLKAEDPKRVDLLDKYDKLKRRQGATVDDNTIHFYLPRPECDTCPFRGDTIITEPEPEEPEEEEEEERGVYVPHPGYTVNGKRIGRPPKKRKKTKKAAQPEPEEEEEEEL